MDISEMPNSNIIQGGYWTDSVYTFCKNVHFTVEEFQKEFHVTYKIFS